MSENLELVLVLFLTFIQITIPAYILGSLNGAIITSKLFYRKDIREYGSGNAGLTNAYRVLGKGAIFPVVLIDVLKTVLPVLFGGWRFSYYIDIWKTTQYPDDPGWFTSLIDAFAPEPFFGAALAGFAVMLGHCFPVFYKFKGGKGVMAVGAIVFVLDWRIALIAWGVFIILTALTRYVSLGSIIGSMAIPVSAALLDIGGLIELIVLILCVLLVVIRHAENIKRIIKGEESKLSFKRAGT